MVSNLFQLVFFLFSSCFTYELTLSPISDESGESGESGEREWSNCVTSLRVRLATLYLL
jgi:hypothetical protein